ncbi:L,D-transpeptidase family protein [Culturomica massiliensis]|uniref:L,D-transpeptidase family protein n=2 Tax=Culturomica massiliensis TaxID=1841857 RepID=UPI000E55CB77|nr:MULTISPECIES: L,D-transpeptidase family protein [Odoribacteraceae]RHV96142.1 hypothetical protein DXA95_05750 [Odoribacter sp. OF09-27XD]
MESKRFIKRWGIVMVLLVAGCILVSVCMVEKPPVKEMEEVRGLLSKARELEAAFYCPQVYEEACKLYESAMTVWKGENEKWMVLRSYKEVDTLVVRACSKANAAIRKAEAGRKNLKAVLREKIDGLRFEMKEFEALFAVLPLETETRKQHARGKMLLNAAEMAFEKGDYAGGREKGEEAVHLIQSAYCVARKKLVNYFEKLPVWRKEAGNAVEYSRKNKAFVILVEKLPAYCHLYYKGEKKYSFKAEFGRNWLGDKQQEGDYATPEGNYRVVRKMQGRMTHYYKALLLDYPNAQDRLEFRRKKEEGVLPQKARIGGLIEIHGKGGRHAYWTEGCVALEDKDMDVLYEKVRQGVPVVIVGSTKTLDEALKNYSL